MKPSEYFDAAKERLNIESDYALAKALELPPQSIPAMRKGTRNVPLDVAFRLAITLELDPAQVVADLEEQREKNEKRRGFWRSFQSRAVCTAAVLGITLASLLFAIYGSVQNPLGGGFRWRRKCA